MVSSRVTKREPVVVAYDLMLWVPSASLQITDCNCCFRIYQACLTDTSRTTRPPNDSLGRWARYGCRYPGCFCDLLCLVSKSLISSTDTSSCSFFFSSCRLAAMRFSSVLILPSIKLAESANARWVLSRLTRDSAQVSAVSGGQTTTGVSTV